MKLNSLQRCKPLLGTFIEVSLQGEHSEQALIDFSEQAFTELQRLHDQLSFHSANSDLSILNQKLLQKVPTAVHLSDELSEILALAQRLYKLSDGYYDVTIAPDLVLNKQLPNHLHISQQNYGNFADLLINDRTMVASKPTCIDLGGIAKGYAVDCAIAKIPADCKAIINAGGDLYHSHWQGELVKIKYGEKYSAQKTYTMQNAALATSANYYQGNASVFIDPKTHQQQFIAGSVSVFASRVMIADALTKVVLLCPKKIVKSALAFFNAQAVTINRFGFSHKIEPLWPE